MTRKVRQKEVYTCELYGGLGSEESKKRPSLIIQNDKGNKMSTTTIIVPITSRRKKDYPFHYILYKDDYDFFDCEENIVLCEQPRCIDTSRVVRYLGEISDEDYDKIYRIMCEMFKKE